LKDSKKLSKQQRDKLNAEIQIQLSQLASAGLNPVEIDELGLTAGVRLAMQRAISEITLNYDAISLMVTIIFFQLIPK